MKIQPGTMVGIRPEHLRSCAAGKALFSARLELVENLGEYALAHLLTDDGIEVIAKMDSPPKAASGGIIHLTAAKGQLHCFDESTGLRRD